MASWRKPAVAVIINTRAGGALAVAGPAVDGAEGDCSDAQAPTTTAAYKNQCFASIISLAALGRVGQVGRARQVGIRGTTAYLPYPTYPPPAAPPHLHLPYLPYQPYRLRLMQALCPRFGPQPQHHQHQHARHGNAPQHRVASGMPESCRAPIRYGVNEPSPAPT